MEIVAIIPARGGSRRIPHKNLRLLAGKPLIQWTIEQAMASKYITRVVVSTDDGEISQIAQQAMAEVILQPSILSQGEPNSILRVIKYVLEYLEKYQDYKPLTIVLLQPTSPLRSVEDIDGAIEAYLQRLGDSVASVYNGNENGAVYVFSRYEVLERGSLYGRTPFMYPMPEERSVDIDTEEDLIKAERLMEARNVDSRVLHQLDKPGNGKNTDKRGKGKRGRPRKVSAI